MLLATVFALAAAALHAGWNLRVKTSGDRFVALWGQFLTAGAVCAAGLVLTGLPERDAWAWLAISACIHVGYVACLARAYGAGDFSLAYPLARGGGAMVAAIGGVAFLDDRLTVLSYVAILVITGGLVSFVRPGTSWDSIRWALVVAVLIGCYTLADAVGARRTEGIAYVLATFVGTSITVSAWGLATGHLANLRRTLVGLLASAPHQRPGLGGGLRPRAVRRSVGTGRLRHRAAGVVRRARRRRGMAVPRRGFRAARLASATVVVTGLVLLVVAR